MAFRSDIKIPYFDINNSLSPHPLLTRCPVCFSNVCDSISIFDSRRRIVYIYIYIYIYSRPAESRAQSSLPYIYIHIYLSRKHLPAKLLIIQTVYDGFSNQFHTAT